MSKTRVVAGQALLLICVLALMAIVVYLRFELFMRADGSITVQPLLLAPNDARTFGYFVVDASAKDIGAVEARLESYGGLLPKFLCVRVTYRNAHRFTLVQKKYFWRAYDVSGSRRILADVKSVMIVNSRGGYIGSVVVGTDVLVRSTVGPAPKPDAPGVEEKKPDEKPLGPEDRKREPKEKKLELGPPSGGTQV